MDRSLAMWWQKLLMLGPLNMSSAPSLWFFCGCVARSTCGRNRSLERQRYQVESRGASYGAVGGELDFIWGGRRSMSLRECFGTVILGAVCLMKAIFFIIFSFLPSGRVLLSRRKKHSNIAWLRSWLKAHKTPGQGQCAIFHIAFCWWFKNCLISFFSCSSEEHFMQISFIV